MLSELRIENFAIINKLELNFHRGLNIFTGETGAGKSIIIDAVETILGSRADATMVRSGAERAIIEGSFELSEETNICVRKILDQEGLQDEAGDSLGGKSDRTAGALPGSMDGM
jgi:DNA repair protein RecN (Recombination protein N)